MAGDWIKWEKGLPQKREVLQISTQLNRSPREVAACLMDVWAWADTNTEDGSIRGLNPAVIDGIVGIEGFSQAMADAGWLLADGIGLIFPNFKRHNGRTAKRRLMEAERKRTKRSEAECEERE